MSECRSDTQLPRIHRPWTSSGSKGGYHPVLAQDELRRIDSDGAGHGSVLPWGSIMTRNRDLKLIIRARMKKTGESYTSARLQVLVKQPSSAIPEKAASNQATAAKSEWHHLIETSEEEAKALLLAALDREPRLTHFGLGIFDESRKRLDCLKSGSSFDSVDVEFACERQALVDHLEEIAACADWIRRQEKTKSFNMRRTSYSYKHAVERWFKHRGGPHLYVSNGSFIAAALGLGFDAKPSEAFSPNVHFQFSQRTVKAVEMDRAASPMASDPDHDAS